jgi:hypothetical protein
MTKKLEELFNLPTAEDGEPAPVPVDVKELLSAGQDQLADAEMIIDRIDQALPQVRDLDSADQELDELSDMARDKFEDLMNLGMNVEARFSGQILQTAGVLLGHAITAKQAKIDKKLKMIDLQLKKLRLDQAAEKNTVVPGAVDGQAVVVDRNTLLKQLIENNKNQKTS